MICATCGRPALKSSVTGDLVHALYPDEPHNVVPRCHCCGDLPAAEGRTMCQRCLDAACHPSYNCNRPLDEGEEDE